MQLNNTMDDCLDKVGNKQYNITTYKAKWREKESRL